MSHEEPGISACEQESNGQETAEALGQKLWQAIGDIDEKFEVEAVAQLVEHLDFSEQLNQRLQRVLGEVQRTITANRTGLGGVQSLLREVVMDVALLKRALTSLGQVGVMERRRIEKELILELFPPRSIPLGSGVVVASPRRVPARVECESRLHLCKAACCRIFNVPLVSREVELELCEWDPRVPYTIQKNRLGCMYLTSRVCTCSIYDRRPAWCSDYSCKTDSRIWDDFEKKKLNPSLEKRLAALEVRTGGDGVDATNIRHSARPSTNRDEAVPVGEPSVEPKVTPPDFSALREMIITEPEKKFLPEDAASSETEKSVARAENSAHMASPDLQTDVTRVESTADIDCSEDERDGSARPL
jgi:Fe-S-cluster containining protein